MRPWSRRWSTPVPRLGAGYNRPLLSLVWLSTAAWQAPDHRRLLGGFDPATHRHLVATNWVRTVGWSARGVIALWLLAP